MELVMTKHSISIGLFVVALGFSGSSIAEDQGRQTPAVDRDPQEQSGYRDGQDPSGYQDRQTEQVDYSDEAIHDRVHDAIEDELGGRGQVSVSVHHGVVTLSGQVDSRQDRQLAHDIAHDIDGVRSVRYRRLYAGR